MEASEVGEFSPSTPTEAFSGLVGSNHSVIFRNVSSSTAQAVIISPSLIFHDTNSNAEIKQQDNIHI